MRITRRMAGAGVELLRNRSGTLEIAGHQVEIAGTDFVFVRERREEISAQLFARLPRHNGAPRTLLSHDPRSFFELPDGVADLVLSGHGRTRDAGAGPVPRGDRCALHVREARGSRRRAARTVDQRSIHK